MPPGRNPAGTGRHGADRPMLAVGRAFVAVDTELAADNDFMRVNVVSPKVAVIGTVVDAAPVPVVAVTTATSAAVAGSVATL